MTDGSPRDDGQATAIVPAGSGVSRDDDAGPFLRRVRRVIVATCLVLLAALILTPLIQVVMRGVFTLPLAGAEELARYFLVCLTFIGAAWVTARGGQIRMEELQGLLPTRVRWWLQLVIGLSSVAVFAVFLVASVVTIAGNLDNQTATLELPFWLFMGPLAIGSALLVLESVAALARTWRRGRPQAKQTSLS